MTSHLPLSDTVEIRVPLQGIAVFPAGLPRIPGGWTEREWVIEGRSFRLILPATPDAFLDDADVHAAFERDEYMPYWAYLWPASLKMAATVLRSAWPREADVLELGCGIGVVGLAGLTQGLNVTFSDYEPVAVELAVMTARRAGYSNAQGLVFDWRQPPNRKFSLIWGCELLYEDRNHQPLLCLLRQLLAPEGKVWFVDGGRMHAEAFWKMIPTWGLSCQLFDENFQTLAAPRVGKYQLFEIRHA